MTCEEFAKIADIKPQTIVHLLAIYGCQRLKFSPEKKPCLKYPSNLCAVCWLCQSLGIKVPTEEDFVGYKRNR